MAIKTTSFGYPKIGTNRELKFALEGFWNNKISRKEFLYEVEDVNYKRLEKLKNSGLDFVQSNDFSLYDFILDTSTMFGIIPERFLGIEDTLDQYFAMARGNKNAVACEMTKWFDTNYHYIVPEVTSNFELKRNRPLDAFNWIKNNFNIDTMPNVIGPFTLLKLSKGYSKDNFKPLFFELCKMYNSVIKELELNGVASIQVDEPSLVLDITNEEVDNLIIGYEILTQSLSHIDVYVHTFYESLSKFETIVNHLPVQGIGLDFTVNDENIENLRKFGFPKDKKIIAGVVSGRDVWKINYKNATNLIHEIINITGQEDLIISNSSPLFHLPVSQAKESFPQNVSDLISFADDRLEELNHLKNIINNQIDVPYQDFQSIQKAFRNKKIDDVVALIDENNIGRKESFEERYSKQQEVLNLPLFPTTTIGSFPQTDVIRTKRADYKKGLIHKPEYETFINNEIQMVIELQDSLGLDVLVHGEFERTDMVEFFGQQLNGVLITKNGWVQSYGSRCVRPPIIYGDVFRSNNMTVNEIMYAQSCTQKPVKGMLTGPVTILNWSFYRKDIPKKEIAYQIALALHEEVLELESLGVKIIQIDEAAFREGLPLRKNKQKEYLNWAVNAFKLTSQDVKPQTQIHTHMCYSEFNEILEYIYAMDADVISIEASRSKGEIIEAFETVKYDHGIGLGVYDIHSPRVPSVEEMEMIINRSISVIDKRLFWINPDCGLKTRGNKEVTESLTNMVNAAKNLRAGYTQTV